MKLIGAPSSSSAFLLRNFESGSLGGGCFRGRRADSVFTGGGAGLIAGGAGGVIGSGMARGTIAAGFAGAGGVGDSVFVDSEIDDESCEGSCGSGADSGGAIVG